MSRYHTWGDGTPFPFEGPVRRAVDRREGARAARARAADGSTCGWSRRVVGKTSVLLAHASQLRETGWRARTSTSAGTDLTDAPQAAVATRLDAPGCARTCTDCFAARDHGVGRRSRGGLRAAQTPDVQAAEAVLDRLLDLPLTLWRQDATPTLVVFDEFQDLLVARQDLDGLLRSRIQYHGDAPRTCSRSSRR